MTNAPLNFKRQTIDSQRLHWVSEGHFKRSTLILLNQKLNLSVDSIQCMYLFNRFYNRISIGIYLVLPVELPSR